MNEEERPAIVRTFKLRPQDLEQGVERVVDLSRLGGPKELSVKVPAGTSPRALLRVRDLPLREGARDLIVHFDIGNRWAGVVSAALGLLLLGVFLRSGAGYPSAGFFLVLWGAWWSATRHPPLPDPRHVQLGQALVVIAMALATFAFKGLLVMGVL